MENYKLWLQERGLSENTIIGYLSVAEAFHQWILPKLGDDAFEPTHVSPLELQEWKNYLMQKATYVRGNDKDGNPKPPKRYAVSTVQTYIKSIKTYFQYLAETKQVTRNPAQVLRPPKLQNGFDQDPRWLTRRERSRLINWVTNPAQEQANPWRYARTKAIIYLGLHAGLRVSEMSSLTVEDLNFPMSSLFIREGKGNKSRWLPMNADLRKALQEWMEIRGEQDHPYVLVSQKGGKLSSYAIWSLCGTIAEKLRLEHFTPHVLRHTFGHDLIEAGKRLEDVADLMGHSNLNFTRVYVRSRKADKRLVVEALSGEQFE